MPMCLWTFLESYDFTNKHIYPFCTHEGSGLGKSISDLNKICPNAIIHQGLDILVVKYLTVTKKYLSG